MVDFLELAKKQQKKKGMEEDIFDVKIDELKQPEPKKKAKKPKKTKVIIDVPAEKTSNEKFELSLTKDYGEIKEFDDFQYLPSKRAMAEAIDMYRYLMKSIIKDSDFHYIKDNRYLKRSGFRKIAQAFGITLEQIGKEEIYERDGIKHARVKVRASLGHIDHKAVEIGMKALIESGKLTPEEISQTLINLSKTRFADGVGIVSEDEIRYDKGKTEHNLIGFAYTRGASRAIADLVGFGVVSATEVDVNEDDDDIFSR